MSQINSRMNASDCNIVYCGMSWVGMKWRLLKKNTKTHLVQTLGAELTKCVVLDLILIAPTACQFRS